MPARIKRKPVNLFFLLSPVILGILLAVFGFFGNRNFKNTILNHANEQIMTIGQSLALDLNSWLDERYSDGSLFSRNFLFCNAAKGFMEGKSESQEKEKVLNWIQVLEENFNYTQVVLVDTTGRIRLHNPENAPDSSHTIFDYENITSPRIRVGNLNSGPDSRPQSFDLFLVIPLYDTPVSNHKFGYLVAKVDSKNLLSPMLGRYEEFFSSIHCFFIHKIGDRAIVIDRNPSDQLAAYNIELPNNPEFNEKITQLKQPEFLDNFGERQLVYYKRIEETNWMVGTSLSEKEIFTELKSRNLVFILVLSLLFLLSCLVFIVLYNIQNRNLIKKELEAARVYEQSSALYQDLFFNSPVPMWIYRLSDLKFLEVNEAAIGHYGYSREEFLTMDLRDIRPKEELYHLEDHMKEARGAYQNSGIWKHRVKGGKIIEVEITSHLINYQGFESSFVMAYDVTERETELKDLWNNAPVGYHSLDDKGNIIRMNATELKWLGYTEEELVNKAHISKILTPESLAMYKEVFPEFKKRGWVRDVELEFLKKDGSRIPVLLSSTAFLNPDGTFHHARSTVIDDTLLRAARMDKEQKSRMLMKNSFDVIFTLDMDLHFTYISPVIEKLTGFTVEEVMEKRIDQIMTQESMEVGTKVFREQLEQLQEDPQVRLEPTVMEAEIIGKDGSSVWTEIKSGFIYGTDGKPVGILGITRDISERRQMTRELVEARDHARESDKLKSAFLANMSHEIRTPLNAIVGFSGLLEDAADDQERKQFVELINSGTDQLLQILDDILDISRIEAGQLMIRPELVNLPEIFKNLEKQSQLVLSIKKPGKLILKSEITTAGLPETIFCDPSRLIRVMNNLIDNAIKFTEQGEIVFGYQPCVNRRYIKFYVRDTGIGIRNDQLAVIFERFRQGENSLNRKFGGTGLGLSISKSMVEMMGGNFGVVSEEGKGSEFSFTLPV